MWDLIHLIKCITVVLYLPLTMDLEYWDNNNTVMVIKFSLGPLSIF